MVTSHTIIVDIPNLLPGEVTNEARFITSTGVETVYPFNVFVDYGSGATVALGICFGTRLHRKCHCGSHREYCILNDMFHILLVFLLSMLILLLHRNRQALPKDKALELINTGYGTGYNRCAMFVNKPGVTIDPTKLVFLLSMLILLLHRNRQALPKARARHCSPQPVWAPRTTPHAG